MLCLQSSYSLQDVTVTKQKFQSIIYEKENCNLLISPSLHSATLSKDVEKRCLGIIVFCNTLDAANYLSTSEHISKRSLCVSRSLYSMGSLYFEYLRGGLICYFLLLNSSSGRTTNTRVPRNEEVSSSYGRNSY